MASVVLEVQVRSSQGKGDSHGLRKIGKVPAVFYGKGQQNMHLAVNAKDLEKAVSGEMGMNTLLNLKVDGKGCFNALLRDYQAHPIKRNFTHADFQAVDLTKKIHLLVPIHLTGRPVGLKEGGILDQVTRQLEVLCLPTHIPKHIDVDVSALKVGDNLHLSDVKFPEGVLALEKLNVPIASVVSIKEEVVAVQPGAPMAEPEVLTAKKEVAAEGGEAVVDDKKKDAKGGGTKEAKSGGSKEGKEGAAPKK